MNANPQGGARSRQSQSYQNVSRETFLSGRGQKPYKAQDSAPPSILYVRSIHGAIPGGRRLRLDGAGRRQKVAPCKFRSNQPAVNDGIFPQRNYAPRKPQWTNFGAEFFIFARRGQTTLPSGMSAAG